MMYIKGIQDEGCSEIYLILILLEEKNPFESSIYLLNLFDNKIPHSNGLYTVWPWKKSFVSLSLFSPQCCICCCVWESKHVLIPFCLVLVFWIIHASYIFHTEGSSITYTIIRISQRKNIWTKIHTKNQNNEI